MGKFLFVLALTLGNYCHAQLDSVYITLGQSEKSVIKFMNQMNAARPNPLFSIEQKKTNNDKAVVSAAFKAEDQALYKCLDIRCMIEKVDDNDYCISQMVHVPAAYIDHYRNFLNRNFTVVNDSHWVNDKFNGNKDLKVEATITKLVDETYVLVFDLTIKE